MQHIKLAGEQSYQKSSIYPSKGRGWGGSSDQSRTAFHGLPGQLLSKRAHMGNYILSPKIEFK